MLKDEKSLTCERDSSEDNVSQIMRYLKGKSSLMIFEKYADMKYK